MISGTQQVKRAVRLMVMRDLYAAMHKITLREAIAQLGN